MWKYNNAVGCLCGGALLGGAVFDVLGAIIGGLLGTWLGWPRSEV